MGSDSLCRAVMDYFIAQFPFNYVHSVYLADRNAHAGM